MEIQLFSEDFGKLYFTIKLAPDTGESAAGAMLQAQSQGEDP